MLKTHNYEDKTYELVLKKCLDDLNVEETNLYIKSTETEGKLFKSKKVSLIVLLKEDVKNYIKEYINTLSKTMGTAINLEIREVDDIFNVILVSDQNGILIGKDGRTLNSLQLLIRQAISVTTGFNVRVNLDAGSYKAKKMENFEYEIKKIIKEVEHTKVDAKLDPMNSYQRRIVHNLANNYEHITTSSSGEGLDRFITIKYKED